MEQGEILKSPEEIAESLLSSIEKARVRILKRIKRKRRKLIKLTQDLGEDFEELTKKWSTTFVTATAALTIFLTTAAPVTLASIPKIEISQKKATFSFSRQELQQKITAYLKNSGRNRKINPNLLSNLVSQVTGVTVKTALDGNEMPTVWGKIATEKHLKIYPGQTLTEHLALPEEFQKFSWTGISQTPSAWGYYAPSKNLTTQDLIQREKYYLAIQTFSIKNWVQKWPELKDWYKFRKLLVYNPENGKAVIGVVGDAGPARYTGRDFGGSPEIMYELGLSEETTGEVLVFFLAGREDLIPLGPVKP